MKSAKTMDDVLENISFQDNNDVNKNKDSRWKRNKKFSVNEIRR